MFVSKAGYLSLFLLGATVNSSLVAASHATEKSPTVWEEKTHLVSNLVLRNVVEELVNNQINTNAHTTALNIVTAVKSITHIALTKASISGATGSKTTELGPDAGYVKIKWAAALVSNTTHLSDWGIILHDTHADRNSWDNRTIIGSELLDWLVGNQTTDVACMIYDGGDGVEVPILVYAAGNDTLRFHIHASASKADATGISKAVVNVWFYNRQHTTYVVRKYSLTMDSAATCSDIHQKHKVLAWIAT
ncbi:hypothetical protein LA080_004574 [Diaporthe eres]|nr:hypothetical protein LA080_004574 [Diaporthe eres]